MDTCAAGSMSKDNKEREAKWKAESDLRTLVEAAAIKKDRARLKAATAMAKTQMDELKKVSA